ncbi:hypothetical protein [Legionella maceachernii]|uniref:Uncharacterized protein n=1 Tax=Legionella maceachernii TaxID=466 RepID=A0A0W0VUX5_9GAMM|nr:hypothetical protein [Legionella maceachernii]KTD24116.1 hypothetical protein Lmac_2989 [Legionella maceachernii]SJZ86492.1 hypothetical protein SAMN02745128_01284 [Legionella maceachernii]SUO99040.1 Uncharacterised protein [Legionella maceachernii]
MENNRAIAKELQRELSLLQAVRETEYELPEALKHQLWLEGKQVDEQLSQLMRGHHA